jgi:GAF domain-containing protein
VDEVHVEGGATPDTTGRSAASAVKVREERWLDALEQMAAALDAEHDPIAMATITLEIARAATGAASGLIALLDANGATVDIVRAYGYDPEVVRQFSHLPLAAPLPVTLAMRIGAPIAIESREEGVRRFPMLDAILPSTGHKAGVAVPLWADERPAGALALTFPEVRSIDGAEWRFLEAMARLAADGVLRQAAQARERDAAARVAACAEATRAFAEASGDVDSLLLTVAREVVRSGVVDCAGVGVVSDDEEELSTSPRKSGIGPKSCPDRST